MGKPFDKELASMSRELEILLVNKLNTFFKKLTATLGPGKNFDIVITCKTNPLFKAYIEVEIVRPDRWEKIKNKYDTIRWPLGKKSKHEDKIELILMASVKGDSNLSEIFIINYETWVKEGHEEKAPFVKAGGKPFRYRKGQEEPFLAIEKNRASWGYDKLEEYILMEMNKRGMRC